MEKKEIKTLKKKYENIKDVRCPICDSVVNLKWFNFRNGNVVEFIAECWNGDIYDNKSRHVFYFQIEVPECVLVCDEDSEIFDINE